MDKNKIIAEQIAQIARQSSPDLIAQFCEELEKLKNSAGLEDINSTIRHIQNAETRASFLNLISILRSQNLRIDAQSLSLALKSASIAYCIDDQKSHLELVWSGPSKSMSTFRRTDQALSDIISEAKNTLLIVSFAVVKVPHVMASLSEALRRGVSVRIIIETKKDSGGKLKFDGLVEIKDSDIGAAALYIWPESARPKTDSGRTGVLHAKCAVADSKVALISSANLTEAAMHMNMELGVIVRGGSVPRLLANHFESLISIGTLRKH